MSTSEDQHRRSAALRRTVASAAPAFVWTALGCPFDVIKTRMQTAVDPPFRSPLHCASWTVRGEGAGALWKGFLPQLLLSSPYSIIMFGVYDWLRPRGDGGSNVVGSFLAGAASGVAVTAVHNPLELWRVRVQTHLTAKHSTSTNGHWSTNRGVLRGLWNNPFQLSRGASMTLLENVVGNGIYFGSNELLRRRLAGGDPDGGADLGPGREALAGALTGIIFQVAVYPADLIKARLMTVPDDAVRARWVLQKILSEDGFRGLYRGASVMMLRAGIINGAGWPVWRWAQRCLEISE